MTTFARVYRLHLTEQTPSQVTTPYSTPPFYDNKKDSSVYHDSCTVRKKIKKKGKIEPKSLRTATISLTKSPL